MTPPHLMIRICLMSLLLFTSGYAGNSKDPAEARPALGLAADEPDPVLFDFGPADSARGWIVVNDGVMGGKSQGGFSLDDHCLVFSGVTNTDGGGFSSIRGPLPVDADLAQADGLQIRLRGAGDRAFKIDLRQREPDRRVSLSYRADIRMEAHDGWQEIRIPFDEFVGSWRGRRVGDATLRPGQATDLGLFIYDGRDGPFRLEVDRIETYQNISSP